MDDRYLRYLREGNFSQFIEDDEPAIQPVQQVEQQTQVEGQQTVPATGSEILTPEESQQAEAIVNNDTTVADQPLDAQAVIDQEVSANNGKPITDRELIKDVFSKIGWSKYIKEENINAN